MATAKGPGSAALEWDLLALCREAPRPGEGSGAEDERAARAALAERPDLAAVLQPMIEARHSFGVRLAVGCQGARLDPASLQRRVEASAANGDAESLERLTMVDGAPDARLQSAAMLGAPRAQFRVALNLLSDRPGAARTPEQRQAGLSWLQAAAKGDAEAQSYYGSCLLEGCPGVPDPLAARAALESAARRGSSQALGLLSGSGSSEPASDWSSTEDIFAPLPPQHLDSLGLDAADHFAWATLAERLARDGCFGFAFRTTALALAAPARLEHTLRTAELAEARERSTRLWSQTGGATRHALGCD
jgi:TPR repeat protein